MPQFKLSLIRGEGRKRLKHKARRETLLVRSVLSESSLNIGGLSSCLLRISDVKIIILKSCGERKYDTGAGLNDIEH